MFWETSNCSVGQTKNTTLHTFRYQIIAKKLKVIIKQEIVYPSKLYEKRKLKMSSYENMNFE